MSKKLDSQNTIDEMIREAYRIVGEPTRLAELQQRIERATQELEATGPEAAGVSLDAHFGQAGQLFDAIPEGEARDFTHFGIDRETAISAGDNSTLLRLDHDLKVVAIDDEELLGSELAVGSAFTDWLASDTTNVEKGLRNLAESGGDKAALVVRFFCNVEDQRGVLGLAVRSTGSERAAITIRRMGLRWSEIDRGAFSSAFQLTEAESELVRFLVSARSVKDFAKTRGRSLATARTQLKRLQQKLAVGSQGEIISLYAGFVGLLASETITSSAQRRSETTFSVEVDGKTIRFEKYGAIGGIPVVLLHGALEGPFLPDKVREAAVQAGVELFVPWMPFYTGADSDMAAVERIETFVDLLPGLLDELEVESCTLLGCSLSTAYTFAALARHPERFNGLVLAGMAMPLTEIAERGSMNPAWRAPLELGSRFPRFFELFSRAVFRLAMRGEVHQYFDRLFKDSPQDLAIMRDPDVARTMRRAAENRPDRFGAAMAHGFAIMTTDWGPWLRVVRHPVKVVYGANDTVVPPKQIEEFVRKYGLACVGPIENAAGYSLFQAPHVIFDEIIALLA